MTRSSIRGWAWAARSSRAALGSSSALGRGRSWRGRSPENIGTRAGASSQPHSPIRMKNIRSVPSRPAMVARPSGVPPRPGRAASHGLYPSMVDRSMSATQVRVGVWVSR
ncbi:hypothetical protein [Ornithinimicrobium cerasi]|uniref:hypothetical protein n=1 Tax=Ornithinimicrobium cerasi TaxID=2248773 RepID=UPI00137B5FB5|nr:hypothetical protein [Ornithinimicrobium cerasi]